MTLPSDPQQPPQLPSLLRPDLPPPPGRWHPLARAVLFVLGWFVVGLLVPGVVLRLTGEWPEKSQLIVTYFLMNVFLLAQSWLFLRAFDRRSFRTVGLWFYPGWGRELAIGAGVGAGFLVVVVGGLLAARALNYQGISPLTGKDLAALAGSAILLFLAALFEELAFRGYGFQRMIEASGPLVATAVFSALFGGLHLANPSASLFSTVNTALSGVLLAIAYLKTRALWLPIGLHWAWNLFMGPVFALPVSGVRFGPNLLQGELTGPNWLTGGTYGPEGGTVFTVICLVVIVGLGRVRRVSPSRAMQEVLK